MQWMWREDRFEKGNDAGSFLFHWEMISIVEKRPNEPHKHVQNKRPQANKQKRERQIRMSELKIKLRWLLKQVCYLSGIVPSRALPLSATAICIEDSAATQTIVEQIRSYSREKKKKERKKNNNLPYINRSRTRVSRQTPLVRFERLMESVFTCEYKQFFNMTNSFTTAESFCF